MQMQEFIFSNQKNIRIKRHLVFWAVYSSYFFIQSLCPRKFSEFFITDTYYFAFLNVCCFGPVLFLTVYFFIYYLYPKTLQQKKYFLFVLSFLLVYAVGMLINYFTAGIFLNSVHYSTPKEPNFQHRLELGNINTRWGLIIASIALGIKAAKSWYAQQKENVEMVQRKVKAEMQWQKARIHPKLLLRSLDAIYVNDQTGADTSSMIMGLSELLSYSLYESEQEWVPLENELSALKHLLTLEQQNQTNALHMEWQAIGEWGDKYINSMLLVRLVDETINLLKSSQQEPLLLTLKCLSLPDHFSVTLQVQGFTEMLTAQTMETTIRKVLNESYRSSVLQCLFINSQEQVTCQVKIKQVSKASVVTDRLYLNEKEALHDHA